MDFNARKAARGIEKATKKVAAKAEKDLNAATARKNTPEGKARAAGRALKKNGLEPPSQAELRRMYRR